ncbi:hypothetical protein D3C73_1414820 [compost metagenome]
MSRLRAGNAHANPIEGLRAGMLNDRFNAVMAACATLITQSYFTDFCIQVIVNDNQIFHIGLIIVHIST